MERPSPAINWLDGGWKLTIEPVMFIYMCSTFIKFPVFQSLLYEKACLDKYNMNMSMCANLSAVHDDVDLQKEANKLLMASSLCLLLPSVLIALILGSLCDVWSIKKTILIPFFGLLIGDFNYIFQSFYLDSNAYYLLFSDLVFGFSGGFTAVIGILFAYSVKSNPASVRSDRVAFLEGTIGLGGTLGSLLSGYIRQKLGFTLVFIIITGMHVVCVLYILYFVKDLPIDSSSASEESDERVSLVGVTSTLRQSISCRIYEIVDAYTGHNRDAQAQRFLNMVMLALAIEIVAFAGLMDILFSYMRFQLKWTDKEYGWFNGAGTGLSSVTVMLLYPILHKKFGFSNALLAILGLLTKIGNLLILAFVTTSWLAMVSVILLVFSRFISTGLRSLASFYVKNHEQGKIFSFISFMEGMSFLVASFIFNSLYPVTLKLFPGTMLLVLSAALLIPVVLLVYIECNGPKNREQRVVEDPECINN